MSRVIVRLAWAPLVDSVLTLVAVFSYLALCIIATPAGKDSRLRLGSPSMPKLRTTRTSVRTLAKLFPLRPVPLPLPYQFPSRHRPLLLSTNVICAMQRSRPRHFCVLTSKNRRDTPRALAVKRASRTSIPLARYVLVSIGSQGNLTKSGQHIASVHLSFTGRAPTSASTTPATTVKPLPTQTVSETLNTASSSSASKTSAGFLRPTIRCTICDKHCFDMQQHYNYSAQHPKCDVCGIGCATDADVAKVNRPEMLPLCGMLTHV